MSALDRPKIEDAARVIQDAENVLSEVCHGKRRFEMCVPVQETDTDIVIGNALYIARQLLAERDALKADAKTHAEAMQISAREKLKLRNQLEAAIKEFAVVETLLRVETERANTAEAECDPLKPPVTWRQLPDEDSDGWECSGCKFISVWEDSPEDNEVKFCTSCGHPVVFERYVEPSEEE